MNKYRNRLIASLIAGLLSNATALVFQALNPEIPGVNGDVRTLAVDSTGQLYVGGSFTVAGNVHAIGIAKWKNNQWTAIPQATNVVDDSTETAEIWKIVIGPSGKVAFAGKLISRFHDYLVVREWNGTKWTDLYSTAFGLNKSGVVRNLHYDKLGNLIVVLWQPNPSPASDRILKFTAGVESELASVSAATLTTTMCPDGNLYASGYTNQKQILAQIQSVAIQGFAKWNGTNWSSVGTKLVGQGITSIQCDSQNRIHVGGNEIFSRWDTTGWTDLRGTGNTTNISKLIVDDKDHVWAIGKALLSGKQDTTFIWESNGATLVDYPAPRTSIGMDLVKKGSLMVLGGDFGSYGGKESGPLLQYTNSAWVPFATGIGAIVKGFAMSKEGAFYAFSNPSRVGGVYAQEGNSWKELIYWDKVPQIEEKNYFGGMKFGPKGELYAYGVIRDSIGNDSVPGIAKWNGVHWEGVGDIGPLQVNAMAIDSAGIIYIAIEQSVQYKGGVLSGVIYWNGKTWQKMGSLNGGIKDLAFSPEGKLTIVGDFTLQNTSTYIAQWDDFGWKALPYTFSGETGTNVFIRSMAFAPSGDLYVIGNFQEIHTSKNFSLVLNARGIAQYTPAGEWKSLGDDEYNGISEGEALSIQIDHTGKVWVAGPITWTQDAKVQGLAVWDGALWINPIVDVPVDGAFSTAYIDPQGNLNLGGSFLRIGNTVSPFLIRANLGGQGISFAYPFDGNPSYGDSDFNLIVYNETALPVTYTSSKPEVATVQNGKVHIIKPGSTTITVALQGGSSLQKMSRTLVVNPRELKIQGLTFSNRIYNAMPQVSYTGKPTLVNVLSADLNAVELAGTLMARVDSTKTGTQLVEGTGLSLSGAMASNYRLKLGYLGTIDIAKAALVIKAEDKIREAQKENPEFTWIVRGLLGKDVATRAVSFVKLTTTATISSPVGTYPITASGGSSCCYELTYEPGILTLGKPGAIQARSKVSNSEETVTAIYDLRGHQVIEPDLQRGVYILQFNSGRRELRVGMWQN